MPITADGRRWLIADAQGRICFLSGDLRAHASVLHSAIYSSVIIDKFSTKGKRGLSKIDLSINLLIHILNFLH